MRCQADVMVLGVMDRPNEKDKAKPYHSVEVTQSDGRAIQLGIPHESNGLLDRARASFGKFCRIGFSIKPGQEFKQFYLDLQAVEPLPQAVAK